MLQIQDIPRLTITISNNKNNYLQYFTHESTCIKSFLNKLYTPKVIVHNIPKINVFVKLLSSKSTSFQIPKKLQKLLNYKLTPCTLKIVLRHRLRSKAFLPSRISYLRCYFQDLVTSISVVDAMLPIMVRANATLKSKFVNI